MMGTLKEKTRRSLIYLIIAVITFILIGNVGAAKAARQPLMKSTEINHRRFEFNNRTYDVYVNYKEKFISLHNKADSREDRTA